jgi:hypothetical protein
MLFLGDNMLAKEDLLVCKTPPNIRDVSLQLYKEFAETYLIDKIFHYSFLDGTELDVEFTEWGIYHMLSIQHINGKINRNNFFQEISNGLSFDDFVKDKSINNRFKKYKKRITLFACVYDTLKTEIRALIGKEISSETSFYLKAMKALREKNGMKFNDSELEKAYEKYITTSSTTNNQ